MQEIVGKLPGKGEFLKQLDCVFRASLNGGQNIDLRLAAVEEIVSNERQENFSLMFQAPVDSAPSQGTYRLENELLGTIDIFLVPVKKDAAGLYFEAVFNHFVESKAASEV